MNTVADGRAIIVDHAPTTARSWLRGLIASCLVGAPLVLPPVLPLMPDAPC